MSIITGVKQKAQTYQIMMKDKNNITINNDTSSNLINFNVDINSYNDAIINFKNIYHFGLSNNKIIINNIETTNNNVNNLLNIDNNRLNIYRNVNLFSNININNYLYTSNSTTYFNSSLLINMNNNDNNNFKIVNNSISLFELNKNYLNINTTTNFNSNIYMNPNTTIYTNFIDSPNNKPVIINNLAFAESLRILTNNIIHNISIDNSILWTNIKDFMPATSNKLTPTNDTTWSKYMTDNNINMDDIFFTKPNINVLKYISSNVGGSNILEFKIKQLNVDNSSSNLVFSINNNGFINITSNYEPSIPINININPLTTNSSNIFKYVNNNNSNNILSINSNGFINIGSNNFSQNQLNIFKNNNSNINNTELLSLNIDTRNFTYYRGNYTIPFINNNDYYNFIIKYNYLGNFNINSSGKTTDRILITITNKFIENNIIPLNNIINDYTNYTNYNSDTDPYNFLNTTSYTNNIQTKFSIPINTFNIYNNTSNFDFYIWSSSITDNPYNQNNQNLFNKIILNIPDFNQIYTFYIHKYNYNFNYNGNYIPLITDYIKLNSNNINKFSISVNGNTGIGTYYSDMYKLYVPENALITNINCSSIDNILNKNISFCNLTINNVNTINCDLINNNNIYSKSNISSNIQVLNNQTINSNLNVLNNINVASNINICNNSILLNSNIILNNNNANIQIKNNSVPYLNLNNNINSYNICINNNNNFQLLLNNSNSIIENNTLNNSISFIGSSLNVFRDTNSNIKIFAGRTRRIINGNSLTQIDNWYDYISNTLGNETYNTDKSLFYIYANFYLNSPANGNPMINSYISNINGNDYLKIGIGTTNNDNGTSNCMMVNMDTYINGNITVNSNIYLKGTILSPSDSNIKTNIKLISSPIEKINKINGYTYKRTDTGNCETGLIAQEVLEILPEVISFNNDIYNISYGNMCGLLVEAIKELNKKIEILEAKL